MYLSSETFELLEHPSVPLSLMQFLNASVPSPLRANVTIPLLCER
jgi:hypothetical protein